jgi:hypothetical protein
VGKLLLPPTLASGTILLADNCGAAAFGYLPDESPEPSRYRLEYDRGRYRIAKVDATWSGMPWVPLPGRYGDAALVVDVYFPGYRPGGAVVLCCRASNGPATGYHLLVAPAEGQFAVTRWEGKQSTILAPWRPAPTLQPADQVNRLELRCAGTTLAVWLNGTLAATLEDATYPAGNMWVGVESWDGALGAVMLAGLMVVQQ